TRCAADRPVPICAGDAARAQPSTSTRQGCRGGNRAVAAARPCPAVTPFDRVAQPVPDRYIFPPIRAAAARVPGFAMSSKEDERRPTVDRRAFLKGAATGAATIAVATPAANAQSATGASAARHSAPAPAPSPEQLARDAGSAVPPPLPAHTPKRPGSDLMVQTLKEL